MNISILGDSISTYEGYNPIGYNVFYNAERIKEYGLTNVNDTWWMKVINSLNGELCVNNSFSGSTVYKFNEYSISAKERCQNLHNEDNEPDIILIYAGTNDCLGGIPAYDLYYGYCKMIKRINERYSDAQVFCATLTAGSIRQGQIDEKVSSIFVSHNNAIKKAVNENGAKLIDLAKFNEYYLANDNCHPNKEGHNQIAKWWIKELKGKELNGTSHR